MTKYLDSDFNLDDPQLIDALDEIPIWSAPFGINLLRKIRYKPKMKALDIGFGNGFPLTELAMRMGNSSLLYGIDPWEAGIIRAEKKIRQFGIENITILKAEAESIPLENESIDLVVSNNGLNNVNDMGMALQECKRVLKKNGQLVITMNLDTTMVEFYTILEDVLRQKMMTREIDAMKQHIYEKRKPLGEIQQLVQQNGFRIQETEHDGFEYTFLDGSTALNHFFIRLAFLDSWKKIVQEPMRREVFKLVEAVMNEEAGKRGCFTLSVPFVTIDGIKSA